MALLKVAKKECIDKVIDGTTIVKKAEEATNALMISGLKIYAFTRVGNPKGSDCLTFSLPQDFRGHVVYLSATNSNTVANRTLVASVTMDESGIVVTFNNAFDGFIQVSMLIITDGS